MESQSYTECFRNSATTHTLNVAVILQTLVHWMSQKFCNPSYTGCRRNSATISTLDVTETLQPLMPWVSQKFCTTHTQDVAETLRPLIDWKSQKLCKHSYTELSQNFYDIQCMSGRRISAASSVLAIIGWNVFVRGIQINFTQSQKQTKAQLYDKLK